MKINTPVLLLLTLLFSMPNAFSQSCLPTEVEVQIVINTDAYGYETGWKLVNATDLTVYAEVAIGSLGSNQTYIDTFCIADTACLQFTIYDDYGDGIFSPGGYSILMDGITVASGAAFGATDQAYFNCSAGTSCESAIAISEGIYTAPHANYWYSFSPDSVGTYKISTCLTNSCNTRLWMYDECTGIDLGADEAGSLYYNDDNPDCGMQAEIGNAILEPGNTYYIRVGDVGSDCSGDLIHWELSYNGPVVGCMDPLACNYEPLATISGDTCIYPPSTDCPDGPDLIVVQDALVTSMFLSNYTVTDACLVAEECVTGYGPRTLIRFSTHIKNIGTQDYYIGNPTDNPDQFDVLNCHGHTHYKGYAEYILYDEDGNETPVGFKNGFCVMDISCDAGVSAQYGCGTMGITAGCEDVYGAGTTCNWIDITSIDTGHYTFVARTNWDQDPDALGHYEMTYLNNWAQVCLYIGKDGLGNIYFQTDTLCDPYVDCVGDIYGSAQPDCNGICNGPALMGDLDGNGIQQLTDVQQYVTDILGNDIFPESCNDLNADVQIDVADAALLNSCLIYSSGHPHTGGPPHDHCNYPQEMFNPYDTAWLSITDVDPVHKFIDIGVRNPFGRLVAYQLDVSGVDILSVDNLAGAQYPVNPVNAVGGNTVIGISYDDSTLYKSVSTQPLCRIWYNSTTAPEVCIADAVKLVNQKYEGIVSVVEGDCKSLMTSGIESVNVYHAAAVTPNPTDGTAMLTFDNPAADAYKLEILNLQGKVMAAYENILGNEVNLNMSGFPAGLYFYRLSGPELMSGRFIID